MKINNPIKMVKALYYANKPVGAKMPESLVRLPIEMEDGMYNKIAAELPNLEKIAESLKLPMTFAKKGEKAILMNFGSYTTVLRNDELQGKIAEQMYAHANKVAKLK